MTDTTVMDRTYHFILETMVESGVAPHYTEIARAFSVPPEEGKKLLHDLMGKGVPAWLFPDTDHIASFNPLSNMPTQYRISVEGKQKWFGQCSFDSLAACWLFPGKTITIEAPCLDCGEPMRIKVRDGVIESADPPEICNYTPIRWKDRLGNLPHW